MHNRQTSLVFYLLTYVNFLHFLDNDDRMSSNRRNLSALVFHNRHVPANSEHALEPRCSIAAQGLAQSFFSPAACVALRFQR